MAKRKTWKKTPKGGKVIKILRLRKLEDMPLEQWQIALRKQFAQKQNFRLKNVGEKQTFSEFIVTNPQTGGEYRVAIRGKRIGDNYILHRNISQDILIKPSEYDSNWQIVTVYKTQG